MAETYAFISTTKGIIPLITKVRSFTLPLKELSLNMLRLMLIPLKICQKMNP